MTKKQSTTDGAAAKAEKVRAAALRKFGQAIFHASAAYENELASGAEAAGIKVRDVGRPGADYTKASAIAAFVGSAFLAGPVTDDDFATRQTLGRLHRALKPPERPKDEAVEIALSLVTDYAQLHRDAVAANIQPAPKGVLTYSLTASQLAAHLVMMLTVTVNSRWDTLKPQIAAVDALLARFSPGQGRKTKSGTVSKLGAAGILLALNKLADPSPTKNGTNGPLGVTSTSGIDNACARHRKTVGNRDV